MAGADSSPPGKYDRDHPRVTIRFTPEAKAELQAEADRRKISVTALIKERLSAKPSATSDTPSASELAGDVLFLLTFFQANAGSLDINEDQKTRIKQIYAKVKK